MSDTEINGNVCQRLTSSSMEDLSEYTDADESISAPTEILAEFLSAIMTKDYKNALKYCQLILSYEPENSTAKEFYPLIVDKLKFIQREGETDDSLSESSDSYNSTSSSSSESGAYNNKKKHLDSDATTASYSSLEDDEATAANIIHDKTNFWISPKDITNGNAKECVTTNISTPNTTLFKESAKDAEKSEERQNKTEEKAKEEDCKNLLIHSTPTTTLKRDNNSVLCRTQTYTKITNMKKPLKSPTPYALKKNTAPKSPGPQKKANANLNLPFSKKKVMNAKVKDASKTNRQASTAVG